MELIQYNILRIRNMKFNNLKIISFLAVILLGTTSFSFGQNKTKLTNTKADSTSNLKMKEMKMTTSSKIISNSPKATANMPMLYKDIINLKAIDINKDGKIYQCPMDLNVLSDKPGIDPKCGMKLKEVTIKEAKANLIKHGFQVEK
jgi:hypothetical protein